MRLIPVARHPIFPAMSLQQTSSAHNLTFEPVTAVFTIQTTAETTRV